MEKKLDTTDQLAWLSANRPSSYPRETESRESRESRESMETLPTDEHGDAEGEE